VEWLLEQLGVDPRVSLVMYIGDDITDEDAFRALKGRGVGIVVRDQAPRETYADLALDGTEEVHTFLNRLVEMHR
jgi:trehalose 6-phosphate phosphatase